MAMNHKSMHNDIDILKKRSLIHVLDSPLWYNNYLKVFFPVILIQTRMFDVSPNEKIPTFLTSLHFVSIYLRITIVTNYVEIEKEGSTV